MENVKDIKKTLEDFQWNDPSSIYRFHLSTDIASFCLEFWQYFLKISESLFYLFYGLPMLQFVMDTAQCVKIFQGLLQTTVCAQRLVFLGYCCNLSNIFLKLKFSFHHTIKCFLNIAIKAILNICNLFSIFNSRAATASRSSRICLL